LDFSLTEDQRLFQSSLDKSLEHISPLSRVRSQAEAPNKLADDIWRGLCDLGTPGVIVPQEFGGSGLGMLDAALIGEIFGKHVVPSPLLAPMILAPLAINRAGSKQQKAAYLPSIAEGSLRISAAVSEQICGIRNGAGVDHRNGKLFGRALFVVDHVGAHKFIVADTRGDLHLLDRDAASLEIVTLDTVDRTRTTAMLVLDGATGELLSAASNVALSRIANTVRLVLAADLLGAAGKMLEQAVEYAKIRYQFNRPIGSFQAIKHMCAEMAAQLEPGRALLWYAGHALDKDLPDATLCCLHAKAYLAEAARFIARTSTEIHGGIGITDELGLHFWFKRIGWSYQAFGSPNRLREEAAALQDFSQITSVANIETPALV
jgi:alkylation response protein AidB-like acyl-CoA dehydrogenase